MIKKTILGSLFMTCALTAGAQGIYQFADPGFEQGWTNKKEPGNGWHSFATAGGGLASFASMSPSPEHVAEGYQSAHSVKLTSKFAGIPGIMGANANGNLTTGRINMGSMTPSEKTNFNHTDLTGDAEEKLEPQYLEFAGTPDAVTFYAKFTAGTGNSAQQARGKFILHDEYSYGDPEEYFPEQKSHRVALAMQLINESPDWKQYTVPFTYDQDVKPAKQYLLASFTTNPEPGESAGDVLYIDDIYFVYNSELASLTYDDKPVSKITSTIDLSDQVYDASKLSYTLTGKGATAETTSYDEATAVLTLTVKGNDWSVNNANQHVYTIQFAKPVPASEVAGQYNSLIKVKLGDVVPSINNVELNEEADGSLTFAMRNFSFMGKNVGDVMLKNATLSRADDGSINIVASADPVALAEGKIHAKVDVTGNVKQTGDERELTATVNIGWYSAYPNTEPIIPIVAEVSPAPFSAELNGRTLAVTGKVDADVAALVIPTGSEVGSVDLTEVELGDGLATSDFGSDLGNTLFFISGSQALSGNNVVVGGTCAKLVLTDGQPFYAPEAFTADAISYNRTDLVADDIYTFVLPFAVSTKQVNGAVYKLAGITDGVISFAPVADGMLEANKPYLVRATGKTLLADASISGEVKAVTAATVENAVTGVTHVGAYQTTEVTSKGATSWYGYNQEGKFVKAKTGTISPFRTALRIDGNGQSSFALKLDGTVTGIVNLENPNAKVDVYTLSGVCVRKNVPAASALNGLDRGVYIVGGQKVVK